MRKHRRFALALAVAVVPLGVASAAGLDNLLWDGAHTKALVAVAADPLSIFDARSPGARQADALRQTKPGHPKYLAALALPAGPEERVLASVRDRPPEPDLALAPPLLAPNSLVGPDAAPGLPFLPTTSAPGAGLTPAAFTPGNFGSLPPPGGLLLPPNQTPTGGTPPGGGSPPGGGPPGGGPPGGGGPVPEPATWMMMVMATFAVGAALRRRRHNLVNA
jgi:hypothetical protein